MRSPGSLKTHTTTLQNPGLSSWRGGLRRLAMAWLWCCLLCCVAAPALAAPEPLRIAIVTFDAITEDARRNNKGRIVSERLITAAVKSNLFEVVERHMVEQVFSEMEFGDSGLSGPDAQKLGHMLGAEYVLLGTVAEFGGELSIDSRLVRVGDGTIVLAESVFAAPTLSSMTKAAGTLMSKIEYLLDPNAAPPPATQASKPAQQSSQAAQGPTERQILEAFMTTLFSVQQSNDIDFLEKMYGDPVLYYDQGEVSRARIIREKKAYMKRWPDRSQQAFEMRFSDTGRQGFKQVSYKLRWRVSNSKRTLSGVSACELLLMVRGAEVHIVGESSKVISRD